MRRSRSPIKPQRASRGWHRSGLGEPPLRPDPPVDADPWLLDSREVARLLGVGRTKAFQLMARGEVPVVRVDRCVRVPRQALSDWIKSRTQEANRIDVPR
jgi:excisionase family DNA binding protein